MAGPVSTVAAVKAYLFTLFQTTALTVPLAAGDNSTVRVMYAEPGQYQPNDLVCFGTVARDVISHGMRGDGGAQAFAEEYSLEVIVHAFRPDIPQGSGQMAEERAYAILGAIEQAVRDDMTLGGLVWKAEPLRSTLDTTWDPDAASIGYHAHLVAELHCSAVI